MGAPDRQGWIARIFDLYSTAQAASCRHRFTRVAILQFLTSIRTLNPVYMTDTSGQQCHERQIDRAWLTEWVGEL